jgi:Flp pilus assembly protein TadG
MRKPNRRQTKGRQTDAAPYENRMQHGQALVEFALVLLFVILPLTFVLVDGAITLFTLANVTNAAREGARAGSVYQAPGFTSYTAIDAARTAYIQNYLTSDTYGRLRNLVDVNQCNVTTVYSPTIPAVENPFRQLDSMTVRVACPRRFLFGLVNAGSITLTAQSTMKIEPGGAAPQ